MVVAIHRDTETTGREALSSAPSALARESNLSRIRLVGLTQAEVERQLTLFTGTSVPLELAVLVRRRTGGNPFFVTEMGRLTGSLGQVLPDAALDTVWARLARLSGPCRQLIATAALLGTELDARRLYNAVPLTSRPSPSFFRWRPLPASNWPRRSPGDVGPATSRRPRRSPHPSRTPPETKHGAAVPQCRHASRVAARRSG